MALVLHAAPAHALQAGSPGEDAARALRSDPIYVDPSAERAISDAQADRLRRRIAESRAGPLYIAILPATVANSAGGDAAEALRQIATSVGRPGTYAALIGDSFRAGSTVLPRGRAGELSREAFDARRASGTTAVLEDFIDRVGSARRGEGGPGRDRRGDGGGVGGLVLLALFGLPLGLFLFSRRMRRRRQPREDLVKVKELAREDLIALGEEIRALEIDVDMPGADPAVKQEYARAVECYQAADDAWNRARRAQDIEPMTALLEEGRYVMTGARARLEGRSPPERRPPCFFDPRHGPSSTDVEWSPPGGVPRPVPACSADAQRIHDGHEPHARQVPVGGGMTPYWNAGPAYMPWAGGLFGGFGGGLPARSAHRIHARRRSRGLRFP